MNDGSRHPDAERQVRGFDYICGICDDFDRAWQAFEKDQKSRRPPDISKFFPDSAELLRELLKLDTEFQLRRGTTVTPNQYLSVFPNNRSVIEGFFKDGLGKQPSALASAEPGDGDYETVAAPGSSGTPGGGGTSSSLRYKKLKPHQRGGLGEVSLAQDLELNREVALKQIQARYADEPAIQETFIFEAQVTSWLEHPAIVPIHGFGRTPDGRPYYAMRFIRGRTLGDAINGFHKDIEAVSWRTIDRNMSFRSLLGHFIRACNAVQYAHSRGVLHRDIKPANVMVKNDETLVLDWGLAKLLPKSEALTTISEPKIHHQWWNQGKSENDSAIGTPHYMSPEQAEGLM